MKIRNKLSIQFTVLVAAILLCFCIVIYYVMSIQHQNEFYEDLIERANVSAYIYLEKDDLPQDVYNTIRQRYLHNLNAEFVQMYDMNNERKFIESNPVDYNVELINYIRSNYTYPNYYRDREGDTQTIGMFYPDNQGDFVIIASAVDEEGQEFLNDLAWILAFGFSFSLVIILFTGRFFAIQALKPIPRIVNQVNSMSASKLNVRLEEGSEEDELGELIATFNKLLDRIEDNFNIQRRFVANASHELRTPLTSIIGEIEVTLAKKRSTSEYNDVLESIHDDALTLHELSSSLLELAQAESEKINMMFQEIRVDEIVLDACLQIEKKYKDSKINVNCPDIINQDERFIVYANRTLLYNAILNVLDNAAKFSTDCPGIDVEIIDHEQFVQVKIMDNGIGIKEEDKDRIFDPFFRSDSAISKKGYGIGLSVVKKVLNLLNSEIDVESIYQKGTTVTIHLRRKVIEA